MVLLSTLSRTYPLPGVIYNVPLLSGGLRGSLVESVP
jgi:hypothetical protein